MESSVAVDPVCSFDTASHLVRLQLQGELSAERLTAVMNTIAADVRYRHGMHAIADLRECSGDWDYSEVQRFRDFVVRIGGSRQRRWAVIVSPGAIEAVAHLVILISEAVGASIEMRLFDDPRQAQRWIAEQPA
jgi:hypothetical protein